MGGDAKSRWGMLTLDGGTRPPYNLNTVHMVKQPCRHCACFKVYRFAASTFFLAPVFTCDAFNGCEVMK